ncbi:hypothetical protein [Schleiferilactobacillus perolens]|uniref:Uncharacterized protein n=1 Tax=Schleiferilactobacillus perolens DSM 12744 TaxID=1423792 RepID=A0A0R1MRG5_9LACO|nr:hypothetical protein [Schleiferilactobacillus perolens]KRL10752.1 hypothetical protein FD09_GL000895 [Schleiferilactobacillus perolens DSM 12744]
MIDPLAKKRRWERSKANMQRLQASGFQFIDFSGSGQVRIEDWSTWDWATTTGAWHNRKTNTHGRGWNSIYHDIKQDRLLIVCFGSIDVTATREFTKHRCININSLAIDELRPRQWRLSHDLAEAVKKGNRITNHLNQLREEWAKLGGEELSPLEVKEHE